MREEIKRLYLQVMKKESIKERTRAITFRCVVKEHNFKEVNARLNLVTKVCEKFEILEQEEL